LSITFAILAGQVGFITLMIVLGAVLGGLWIDSRFGTRPVVTLILVVLSIPVSVLVMLTVVRSAVARIRAQVDHANQDLHEED